MGTSYANSILTHGLNKSMPQFDGGEWEFLARALFVILVIGSVALFIFTSRLEKKVAD
jgi:hypothetical protein